MGSNPNELDEFERMIMESWRPTFPYLDESTLRLVYPHISDAILRMSMSPLLKSFSDRDRDCYLKPASPEERTILVLADMVVALLSPQPLISGTINNALAEIEEAYHVILERGGGWASKIKPDQRKAAVCEWYRQNRTRLSYLEESYLQDSALYEDRGGQEKRQFRSLLLIKIIKQIANRELTFAKVKAHLEKLKTPD